jgi:hypothetical protein
LLLHSARAPAAAAGVDATVAARPVLWNDRSVSCAVAAVSTTTKHSPTIDSTLRKSEPTLISTRFRFLVRRSCIIRFVSSSSSRMRTYHSCSTYQCVIVCTCVSEILRKISRQIVPKVSSRSIVKTPLCIRASTTARAPSGPTLFPVGEPHPLVPIVAVTLEVTIARQCQFE